LAIQQTLRIQEVPGLISYKNIYTN